jgi:hypothetical protein
MAPHAPSSCATCPIGQAVEERSALVAGKYDFLVALMGNPEHGQEPRVQLHHRPAPRRKVRI